jgi:hypothetical protein
LEKKELSQLIEKYKLQIGIFSFFFLLSAQVPFFYLKYFPNFQLNLLSLRCLILNSLSLLLFLFFKGGKFKGLTIFPAFGVLTSFGYLYSGNSLLMPLCTSSTATSIIEVALVAFATIKVEL